MRIKPYYSETDLLQKDFLTFLRILKEAEAEAKQQISRMEKQ